MAALNTPAVPAAPQSGDADPQQQQQQSLTAISLPPLPLPLCLDLPLRDLVDVWFEARSRLLLRLRFHSGFLVTLACRAAGDLMACLFNRLRALSVYVVAEEHLGTYDRRVRHIQRSFNALLFILCVDFLLM